MSFDYEIEDSIPTRPARKMNTSAMADVFQAARENPGKAILVKQDWSQTKSKRGALEAAKSKANNIRIGAYAPAKVKGEFDALAEERNGVVELRVWLKQPEV